MKNNEQWVAVAVVFGVAAVVLLVLMTVDLATTSAAHIPVPRL